MSNWYVNPASSGTNIGTSANPFISLQTAMSALSAGDNVYCQGTQTLSDTITTLSAGLSTARISIIGVNSSWIEDGTYFTLNGNSTAAGCLTYSTNHVIFRNIECKNATSIGVSYTGSPLYNLFFNCWSHNNGTYGFYGYSTQQFYKCTANNVTIGFATVTSIINCIAYGCTGTGGFYNFNCIMGSIAYDCTSYGIYNTGSFIISNCVVNNCNNGMVSTQASNVMVIGNRFTNNVTAGIVANTPYVVDEDYNFFLGNGNNIVNTGPSGYCYSFGNSLSAGTEGYVNKAGKNFNLTDGATLRRTLTKVGSW